MSKNRLDENTIRRFMGLAGLEPIGESFFDRVQEQPEEEPGAEFAPEVGADEPPIDAEMPVDDAAPAEDPAATEAAAEIAQDVASAVADAMTTALGKHGVTVDAGAGEAAPEVGLEPEPEPDLGAEEAPLEDEVTLEGEAAPEDESTVEEESQQDDSLTKLESSDISLVDDEKIVQEVARRVAARLLQQTNQK